MSAVELSKVGELQQEFNKVDLNSQTNTINTHDSKSQQHPLHQYDLTKMAKFYESCISKVSQQKPEWKPSEWEKATPMPTHLSAEDQKRWTNPIVFSEKQKVYESFVKLAKDLGEPMICMPSMNLNDLQNFELFLDSLKQDGINSIRKYKQYLSNKDMRKEEIDLVIFHARYGIILVEVKESDYIDYRRRSRAKIAINQAKSIFKSLGKLIAESKGLSSSEFSVPVMEFVALPNVREKPQQQQQQQQQPQPTTPEGTTQQPTTPAPSSRTTRQVNYLIKSDLESKDEFFRWWSNNVVQPKLEQEKLAKEQQKVNKFDTPMLNSLVSLVQCIRTNSVLPVVYPESGSLESSISWMEKKESEENKDEKDKTTEQQQFQPALNIHAEFFRPKHEEARALSKCLLLCKDFDRIRKTICLQTLWLLLNDSQKKISVVCTEANKALYEEFFARQRKIYSNLNNLRFYTDLNSCDVGGQHTLKKDGEVWIFDSSFDLDEIFKRVKFIPSFWIFTDKSDSSHYSAQLNETSAKVVNLDDDWRPEDAHRQSLSPLTSDSSIKLPLRLQCDLLVIGDMISQNQLKQMYKYLQNKTVLSQASHYQPQQNQNSHYHHNHHYQQLQLSFNPSKKFRSVKFIRGGTIDNIRNSLKMHDSIQAPVIIMHVGDEDLFKTRNSIATVERVKELTTLVKEYCPKSFCVLSTLMRRMSRTENQVTGELNKGIINFCKQTRDTLNCFYMLNNHFQPDYDTQGGRLLNNKGLKLYVENILFVVDYFLVKNNKQH